MKASPAAVLAGLCGLVLGVAAQACEPALTATSAKAGLRTAGEEEGLVLASTRMDAPPAPPAHAARFQPTAAPAERPRAAEPEPAPQRAPTGGSLLLAGLALMAGMVLRRALHEPR